MTKKILLIQLRQLGDILLTTPCIRAVKEAYQDAEVSFLTHPMGKLVLDGNPWLDKLFTYNPDSTIDELRLMRKLRGHRFDLVLDFMHNPRSALYSLTTGSRQRLSFRSSRSFAYTHLIPRSATSDYIVREKFRLLRELPISPSSELLCLPWYEKHLGPHRELTENVRYREASLRVILSPTHRRAVRQWKPDAFAALSDRLVEEWGAEVLWIWGPGELEFVESMRERCSHPTLLCPKTSFRELAAVIANADLFVGTSNGPSHVAVSVNTPSLQLHGPTQASAWCPNNELHRSIQSPTHLSTPEYSMQDISEKVVWEELEKFQPFLHKKAEARKKFGDRIQWDQTISWS